MARADEDGLPSNQSQDGQPLRAWAAGRFPASWMKFKFSSKLMLRPSFPKVLRLKSNGVWPATMQTRKVAIFPNTVTGRSTENNDFSWPLFPNWKTSSESCRTAPLGKTPVCFNFSSQDHKLKKTHHCLLTTTIHNAQCLLALVLIGAVEDLKVLNQRQLRQRNHVRCLVDLPLDFTLILWTNRVILPMANLTTGTTSAGGLCILNLFLSISSGLSLRASTVGLVILFVEEASVLELVLLLTLGSAIQCIDIMTTRSACRITSIAAKTSVCSAVEASAWSPPSTTDEESSSSPQPDSSESEVPSGGGLCHIGLTEPATVRIMPVLLSCTAMRPCRWVGKSRFKAKLRSLGSSEQWVAPRTLLFSSGVKPERLNTSTRRTFQRQTCHRQPLPILYVLL